MSQQNHNIDTTYTRIYVGGLPWTTSNHSLRSYFQQFGDITHVNIVYDRATQRSRGYGFVTFRDAEFARRACEIPNPLIEGRIVNCRLASSGVNVNHNQQNLDVYDLNPIYSDDLCFLSPTFREYMQLPPLPHPIYNAFTSPYWNQSYPQYHPPYYNYQQYHPPYYNYQQYHLQQHEPGNNIDPTLQAQPTDVVFGESSNQR